MAAKDIQNSLLKAIDYLANARIDQMQVDKTVTATIHSCTNALTGEYRVNYNGGQMFAYSQDNQTYSKNTKVYVHVPLGDFSNKKTIIGKAQNTTVDNNISFVASALNSYNLIGKNAIIQSDTYSTGLYSYRKQDYKIIYQYNDPDNSELTIDYTALTNSIQGADALLIETSFATRLPKEHRLSNSGKYGVQFVLAFKDGDNPNEIKHLSYVIDSDHMTGNPFNFNSWSDQYSIFQIDTENFLYIDSIMAFSQGFVEKTDEGAAQAWGADIKLKEFEIYGLKTIAAENDEYRLQISTPNGNTFSTISVEDALIAIGKFTQQNTNNLSDSATYYWFVEDSRVTSTSEYYHMYGGIGWRYLKEKGMNYQASFYGNDNKAYINKYMCVCVYQESVILKDQFILYNEACKRDITITSSLGERFSFDRGNPTLTCLVNGHSSNFDQETVEGFKHDDTLYSFVWSKTDNNGLTTIFNRTAEDIKKDIEAIMASDDLSYATVNYLKTQQEELEGVEFTPGKNTLVYPMKHVDLMNVFTCEVFLKDHISDEEAYSIGSASIVLQNDNVALPEDYYVIIENGDQVFQYYEDGTTPCTMRYDNPIKVKPLICHFYDPAGLEVNKETYNLKWVVPTTDTLLTGFKDLHINPANSKIEWLYTEQVNFEIAETYDYNSIHNQISCIVDYNGQTYTKDSNFLFTKVGENGTNGSDIVAKIEYAIDSKPKDEEVAIIVDSDGLGTWNCYDGSMPIRLDLYEQNIPISANQSSVSWNIVPNNSSSKVLQVNSGRLQYYPIPKNKCQGQIVRGQITLNGQTHYAFKGVPIIKYYQKDVPYIKIDPDTLLKSITYNPDGRNPLYNKNQGIKITLENLSDFDGLKPYIVYSAIGGIDGEACCFKLSKEKNVKNENATFSVEPDTIQTPKDVENEQKAIETARQAYSALESYCSQPKLFTKLRERYAEVQAQLDKDLASTGKIITLPDYCFMPVNELYTNRLKIAELDNAYEDGKDYTELLKEVNEAKINYKVALRETFNNSVIKELRENQQITDYGLLTQVYIQPNEVFNGEYPNNLVQIQIYTDSNQVKLLAEVFIPIYMHLNLYALASLNAWDGVNIEINEKENYIIAPQIGAGEKDKNNTFTGIVMGKATYYDSQYSNKAGNDKSSLIGLLGYAHGEQSIFLDAETGNATFGLTEQQASSEHKDIEGRIELRPGGESKIGEWKIGTRSLYNIVEGKLGAPYKDLKSGYKNSIPNDKSGILLSADPSYISIKGTQYPTTCTSSVDYTLAASILQPHDSFELQLDPNDSSVFSLYQHTSAPRNITEVVNNNTIAVNFSVRENKDGKLEVYNLNNDTTTTVFSRLEYNGQWTILKKIANIENAKVIDKNQQGYAVIAKKYSKSTSNGQELYWEFITVATTASQTSVIDNDEKRINQTAWTRIKRVGIDNRGRFYTNALKDTSTALTIGAIGAFGIKTTEERFIGASFDIGDKNRTLFKIFLEAKDEKGKDLTDSVNTPMYIGTSSSETNDFQRAMNFYGSSVNLYAATSNANTKIDNRTSKNKILLSSEKIQLIHEGSKEINLIEDGQLQILNKNSSGSILLQHQDSNNQIWLGKGLDINVASEVKKIQGASTINIGTTAVSSGTISATGNLELYAQKRDGQNRSKLLLQQSIATLGVANKDNTNISTITLRPANQSNITVGNAFEISTKGTVNITTNGTTGANVNLRAGKNTYLFLTGGDDKVETTFTLSSTRGTLASGHDQIKGLPKDKGQQNYISTSGNFYINQYAIAKDYYFQAEGTGRFKAFTDEKEFSSTNLWEHFLKLYSLVNTAMKRANSAHSLATTANNAAIAAQTTATSAANALGGSVNSNGSVSGISNLNDSLDNYVTKSTYNSHTHSVTVVEQNGWKRFDEDKPFQYAGRLVGSVSISDGIVSLGTLIPNDQSATFLTNNARISTKEVKKTTTKPN